MKNKKGFTLIELLAIIVILAIIAVITVPIILNIIENSKKGAAIDSAYAYKEAIYKGFLTDLTQDNNKELPNGIYVIDSTGKLINSNGVVLNTNVSGNVPEENSWVELEKGQVVAYSLKMDDYVVTKYKDTDAEAIKNGEIAENAEARESMLEALRQTSAKTKAKTLATSQTGSTEIVEITEGWVAFINGEVKAYSVSVTEGDYTYVVTDLDVDSSNSHAVADRTISDVASKTQAEQLVVSAKVDSYVKAALSAYSSIDSEDAKLVSDMSGVTTNQPNSGWIHFNKENNNVVVVDYSLTYGTLTANYLSLVGGNYTSTFGPARSKPAILEGTVQADGAKYLTTAQEIYYNPVNGAKDCNGQEGCMHWYLYSVKGDYANMMLDHNITEMNDESGEWASEDDYSAGLTAIMDGYTITGYETTEGSGSMATSAGITYPNNITSFPKYGGNEGQSRNARGPVTALNTLKSLTSGWDATQTPKVPNSTGTNEYIVPMSENEGKFQINYSGYKARLITYEETEYLGCVTSICPDWMIKATRSDNSSTRVMVDGYWTSSPVADSYYAWNVRHKREMNRDNPYNYGYGIRPVITVSVIDVF